MTDMNDIVAAVLGTIVKSINKDTPTGPELHLYLNKSTQKITITVEFPVLTDLDTIGSSLLDAVKTKLNSIEPNVKK